MIWLSGWIKELILIILIAAFTDLILPSHALQRYVRTVIGLFLLLVLLSPIYELFHQRWLPNQWMQAAMGDSLSNEPQMQPLSEIVKQSNELKALNQQQAKQLLEEQLAVSMTDSIESQNGVKVVQLQVRTELNKAGKPVIASVEVELSEEAGAGAGAGAPQTPLEKDESTEPFIAAMKPIDPVNIDLDHPYDQPANATESNEKATTSPLQKQIRQYISTEWQLKTEQIIIR